MSDNGRLKRENSDERNQWDECQSPSRSNRTNVLPNEKSISTRRRNYTQQKEETKQDNQDSQKQNNGSKNSKNFQKEKGRYQHQPRNVNRGNSRQQITSKNNEQKKEDDSGGWDQSNQQKVKTKRLNGRDGMGRQNQSNNKQDQKDNKMIQKQQQKDADTSNWLDQLNQQKKQQPKRGGRGGRGRDNNFQQNQKKQTKKQQSKNQAEGDLNFSILKKQVDADDQRQQLNTSWGGVANQEEDKQPKAPPGTRGNRKIESNQTNQPPVRGNRQRGNYEPRDNDDRDRSYQKQGFRKKNFHQDGNRGGGFQYNNNRTFNNNNYRDRGGRGGGRGRQGDRQRRDYNENYYQNGRGGQYNRSRSFNKNTFNYNNRDNQNNRENRDYRERNQRNNNYQHVNRNYDSNNNYNRSQYTSRRDNRPYQPNQNNYGRNNFVQNERKAKMIYESGEKKQESFKKQQSQKTLQKIVEKKVQIQPRGQKCWPQMSIYIMQTKLSFSYRQITEHQCDILIIPYRDLKFDIYPGNIINKCKADYRKKIQEKGAEIEQVGYLYPQKCVGIDNFKALGFLKLGKNPSEIKTCILGILPKLKQLKITVTSVLIPYSKQMGTAKQFIRNIIQSLNKYEGFTEINISTNIASDFKAGIKVLTQQIEGYMDENKICIDY